jgi:RNA polymerase sigma factor (sigma-70 family)
VAARRISVMSSTGVQSREEDWLWGLICKARSGDKQAATDLVSERSIFNATLIIAQRIIRGGIDGDYKDVDDLHQEILLRIWLRITDFKGESKGMFWAWIRVIARSKQCDDLRAIKRERERIVKKKRIDKNRQEDDDSSFIEDLCEKAFTDDPCGRIWISELLDRLSPLERRIFERYFWRGETLIEIAAALKDSPDKMAKSTVDRHWKKIQKKLIEIIGSGKY